MVLENIGYMVIGFVFGGAYISCLYEKLIRKLVKDLK